MHNQPCTEHYLTLSSIHDFEQQVVAAVHAGWRGVVGHIARNTVEEMKKLGSNVCDIRVVIGPSIGPASFEVGDEVVRAFLASNFPDRVILHNYVKPHIDLWASVAFELEEIGVNLQNVQIAGVDTFTHSDKHVNGEFRKQCAHRFYKSQRWCQSVER